MNNKLLVEIANHHFWLSPDKLMYWEEASAIIASDLHFGKTAHFRKAGIAVPSSILSDDLDRLTKSIAAFHAKQLIVVGDMFHSIANNELDIFLEFRASYAELNIHLILGNHDILPMSWYEQAGINTHHHYYLSEPFCFCHDPNESLLIENPSILHQFSGHLHPSVYIKTGSRQTMRFPCFWVGKTMTVLPAYSKFTGAIAINPGKEDKVYAVVNHSILQVQ